MRQRCLISAWLRFRRAVTIFNMAHISSVPCVDMSQDKMDDLTWRYASVWQSQSLLPFSRTPKCNSLITDRRASSSNKAALWSCRGRRKRGGGKLAFHLMSDHQMPAYSNWKGSELRLSLLKFPARELWLCAIIVISYRRTAVSWGISLTSPPVLERS